MRRFVSRCGAAGALHHPSLDSMRQHSTQCPSADNRAAEC